MKWIALLLLLGAPAYAHDASKAKTPEEARVFDFYATWMRPPARSMSCCNTQDCHVVEIKRKGEQFFFKDYPDHWREIPPDRLEQNASDPRESPDGNSHVCFNQMYVLCAVLGSGQ